MKKNVKITIATLLVAVIMLTFVPHVYANGSPFNDVLPDFWAYDAIVETYNDEVMTGTAPQTFSPDEKLDMAQFTTILARAFYKDELTAPGPDDDWWAPAYRIAYYENHNLFGEVHNIASNTQTTREVMAEMMYRVMVDKGAVLPNDAEIQMAMNRIPDLASVDSNFRTAVAVCYYLDLLTGVDANGTFAPKGVLNRAQTAVIYTRLKSAISLLSDTTNPGTTTNPGVTTDPGTTKPEPTDPGTTDPGETETPSEATLTNGMPVTEENVLTLIEEYRNGKDPGQKAKDAGFTSYEDFSSYDAYNPPYSIMLLDGRHEGTECAKFAFAFFDDIFGSDTTIRKITDPADVRPGDLIHVPGHWSVATEKAHLDETSGFIRAFDVGAGNGSIGWSTIAVNITLADQIYTRYPN